MNTLVDILILRCAQRLPMINQCQEQSLAASENRAVIHLSGQTMYRLVDDDLVDSSDPIIVHEFDNIHQEMRFNADSRELLVPEINRNLMLHMLTSAGFFSQSQIEFIKQNLSPWVLMIAKRAWDEKSVGLEIFVDIKLTVTRPIRRRFMGVIDVNEAVEGSVRYSASRSSLMVLRSGVYTDGGGQCAVCLEDLERGVEATEMPCSHIFHTDCIQRWFKYKSSRPICRFEMPDAPFE